MNAYIELGDWYTLDTCVRDVLNNKVTLNDLVKKKSHILGQIREPKFERTIALKELPKNFEITPEN